MSSSIQIENGVTILNGVLGVYKPCGYLCSDITDHIKKILTATNSSSIPAGKRKHWKMPELSDLKTIPQKLAAERESADGANKKTAKSKGIWWPLKQIKVGHGGTLDPLASGVLIIGLGTGTKKLTHFLGGNACRKTYIVEGKLGFATDSYDATGTVTESDTDKNFKTITQQQLQDSLHKFTGNILQTPPKFSAIRVDGKRMYDLARKEANGEDVHVPELSARPILVHSISLLSFLEASDDPIESSTMPSSLSNASDSTEMAVSRESHPYPTFRLEICCGGGTYIRSIVHDLGKELNTFAHMVSLERSQQGPFVAGIADDEVAGIPCLTLEQLINVETIGKSLDSHANILNDYYKQNQPTPPPSPATSSAEKVESIDCVESHGKQPPTTIQSPDVVDKNNHSRPSKKIKSN